MRLDLTPPAALDASPALALHADCVIVAATVRLRAAAAALEAGDREVGDGIFLGVTQVVLAALEDRAVALYVLACAAHGAGLELGAIPCASHGGTRYTFSRRHDAARPS